MLNPAVMFIAGHSRLPQGMAAKNVYDTLTITAEVEIKYGVILEASCSLATEHGRDFVGRLLRGISLNEEIDKHLDYIQQYYRGKAANALVAAFKDLALYYHQQKSEIESGK